VDTREFEIVELKSQIKKKGLRMKLLEEQVKLANQKARLFSNSYNDLHDEYLRLERRFEANFKFHGYIKDVLDQTADLMKEV
jgi:hypothetical protein